MNGPIFFFLSVGACALFSFIGVATWSDNQRRERTAFYRSETLKKIAEAQEPGASKALEGIRLYDSIAVRRQRDGLRLGGLITTAVGVALMIFIHAVQEKEGVYLVGMIPLLVGAAMLAFTFLQQESK